mgnify:CR=1 FL=1
MIGAGLGLSGDYICQRFVEGEEEVEQGYDADAEQKRYDDHIHKIERDSERTHHADREHIA